MVDVQLLGSVVTYADDTTIFIKSTQNEITNLAQILHHRGLKMVRLSTNFPKTLVAPIHCERKKPLL